MTYLRLSLVLINALALLVVLGMVIRLGRDERHLWVRRLLLIVGLVCGALFLGSLQRLSLQAVQLGWLPESTQVAVLGDMQLVQSLVVSALIFTAYLVLKRLANSMAVSDRLTKSLLGRVKHVDPATLNLTKREREVLLLIGEGVVTDAELSARLHISPSTVQTHVKSLFRKTSLNSRKDLMAVALLVDPPGH